MTDQTMGIRELAERTGATPHTLRYYERALRAHRDDVRERLDRLREHLEILDHKVARGCAPGPSAQPEEES